MKKFFGVIGNPPYQQSDEGNGASASPVYQHFVNEVKKLNPETITLVIPAKWYSGGKGLDGFRYDMLNDRRISAIEDFTDSRECFPNADVAGGVCYFVWKHDYNGDCRFTNHLNGVITQTTKALNEHDVFIRYPMADGIINKVIALEEPMMSSCVSSRKPFGLATNVKPMKNGDLILRYNKGTGPFSSEGVLSGQELIYKWNVMLSYLTAEHAGQPDKSGKFKVLSTMELLPPGTVCTETYLIAGSFEDKGMAENLLVYLKTKFVRFLVGQVAMSQHVTKGCFRFVPVQDFHIRWDDELLYEKYGLEQDEIEYIENQIKEMV